MYERYKHLGTKTFFNKEDMVIVNNKSPFLNVWKTLGLPMGPFKVEDIKTHSQPSSFIYRQSLRIENVWYSSIWFTKSKGW